MKPKAARKPRKSTGDVKFPGYARGPVQYLVEFDRINNLIPNPGQRAAMERAGSTAKGN